MTIEQKQRDDYRFALEDMALKHGNAAAMLSDKSRAELFQAPAAPVGQVSYIWNSADCTVPVVCHLEHTDLGIRSYMTLLAAYVNGANIADFLDDKLVTRVEELALRELEKFPTKQREADHV